MDMFERFTDRARKVMALANQEAQRFNHEYIGTEHILLGLVKEGSGVGPRTEEPRRRPAQGPPRSREAGQERAGHGHDGQAAPDPPGQEGHRVRDREARNLNTTTSDEHLCSACCASTTAWRPRCCMNLSLKLEK
jgi:ATP-dependent Clp protease ATP-binding subunit ClpC